MRPRALLHVVLLVSMLAALVAAAPASTGPRPAAETTATVEPVTMTGVPIAMSDGAELVGDVHLPDADGRFPVLLNMTPYGPGTYFTTYLGEGYAHVNVDIRGSGRSGGALCIFCEREQQDVYEAVEWVAAQPWSDGNVGMYGGSYQGITPLMGAAKQPPHLKAIVPAVALADAYRDIVWHNGIFNANFVAQWLAAQTALSMTGTSTSSDLPARAHQNLVTDSRLVPWDGPYYWERSIYTKHDRIEVPVLHIGGWFDGFSRGTLDNFAGIASKHNRMIMQPCTHKGCGAPFDPASDYTDAGFPPDMPDDPVLAWFDRFLKSERNGIEAGPAAWYFDIGDHAWKSAETWPPEDASLLRLKLSGEPSGTLGSVEDGSLTSASPRSEQAIREDRYVYDPSIGVTETAAKWGTVALSPHARVDQRPDEARALTYTTAAFEGPLSLAGPSELRFWGMTTASDTDWIVKLADVAPDGSSTLLTSGYLRASHRTWDEERSRPGSPWISNEEPAPVPPGKILEYRIDIWDIAHTIQPGHRLRMTISSADTPNHEPLAEPAVNAVFHDHHYPSALILTVRPQPRARR